MDNKNKNLLLISIAVIVTVIGLFLIVKDNSSGNAINTYDDTDFYTLDNDESDISTLPIFLTTMTHMEGSFFDDRSENVFNEHIETLIYALDLADEYNAILTIETENPFAIANKKWTYNFLQEIINRGHGVGTHCDVGSDEDLTYEEYLEDLTNKKDLIDSLVGEENNLGCSGAGSHLDWVSALNEAGFTYVDGGGGLHILALPLINRPDGYTDEYIRNEGGFHNYVPVDLLDRIYLRKLADTQDLEHDDDGILVFSPGSFGKLNSIEEGGYVHDAWASTSNSELDNNDVDKLIELINLLNSQRDRSKIAKINIYFSIEDWENYEEDVLRYFFSEMKNLQDEGVIQWSSQVDVVKTYLEYE